MKIKVSEITDSRDFLSHMILDCFNKEASKTIPDTKEGQDPRDKEHDICLTFNGVELDIREFCKHLEESYDASVENDAKPQAVKLFEDFKQKYKSENSNNAKLSKIKTQLDKINNQFMNVNNSITELSN